MTEYVEVMKKSEDGKGIEISLEVSPQPSKKLNHEEHTQNQEGKAAEQNDAPESNAKQSSDSPNSRRQLPVPPITSSPKEDSGQPNEGDNDSSLTRKFRYDTITRKKKENKKNRNSSTFYLVSSVHSEPNVSSLSHSDSTLSINSDVQKSPKGNSSPNLARKGDSPLLKVKDSPQTKGTGTKSKTGKIFSNHSSEKQTHIALYKFLPRHKDELAFSEGDPIHVNKMHDDLWYEGINISSGKQGVFPCRYVADIMSKEVDSAIGDPSDHKQFYLRFLGSVEVQDHKGDEVLLYAIARVVNQRSMLSSSNPPTCVLQVSTTGVRISNMDYGIKPQPLEVEKKPKKGKQIDPGLDSSTEESHYFSLKNVTFCGNHPKDKRYFGFITKHPDEFRFACHVMMSKYSTDPIAKVFGQSFDKFYTNFMEYRASTEDIYLE